MIFSLQLHTLLESSVLQRIGWALAHSVWQDALVVLCLAGLLACVSQSNIRYLLACSALLLMTLAPIATFALLSQMHVVSKDSIESAVSTHTRARPIETISHPTTLAIAAVIWIAGVLLLSIRQLGGWMVINGLRRNAIAVTDLRLLGQLNMLASQYGIHRKVALAASSMVQVPCIVGFVKPIILLPCSTFTELSPAYLESLLAHELAHVRRHDYLVNLVQTVVETLLFYHPAAWWVSPQIRIEREYCCDDLAVRATGNRHLYCEAMAAMEQIRCSEVPLAMAANGGSLLVRLRRLLEPSAPRTSLAWPAIIVPMMIIAAGLCMVQAQTTSTAKVQLPRTTSATTNPASITNAPDFTLQTTIPLSPSSSLTSLDPFTSVRGPDGNHAYFPLLLEPPPALPINPNPGAIHARQMIFYEDQASFPANEPAKRITGKIGSGTLQVSPDLIDDRRAKTNLNSQTNPSTTQPATPR